MVELDGGQHYSEAALAMDRARNEVLRGKGLKVLKFSDRDVFENIGGVVEEIWSYL